MRKSTLVSFLAILIASLKFFYPVISAPMDRINNQIYHPLQRATSLPVTKYNEIDANCAICYDDENMTDICYFDCQPSGNYPKGHTYCKNCIVNIAIREKPCPFCQADMNHTKVVGLMQKDPLLKWTYYLEYLKYQDFDLTLPIAELSVRIKSSNFGKILFALGKILLTGANIYHTNIKPIIFKAIGLISYIQNKIREDAEYSLSNYEFIVQEKRKIIEKYIKHGNYEVVKEVILQSNSESEKKILVIQMIWVSFYLRNINFLYDEYMTNIATHQEKQYHITYVIGVATNLCFLDGLLDLIVSIFQNEFNLIKELTKQVFKMSEAKYRETGDDKCRLASTNEYDEYFGRSKKQKLTHE